MRPTLSLSGICVSGDPLVSIFPIKDVVQPLDVTAAIILPFNLKTLSMGIAC